MHHDSIAESYYPAALSNHLSINPTICVTYCLYFRGFIVMVKDWFWCLRMCHPVIYKALASVGASGGFIVTNSRGTDKDFLFCITFNRHLATTVGPR